MSHLARAYRWKLALYHLPEKPKIALVDTFAGIWMAYLINYATPRLGEAGRAGVIAKRYDLPFGSVLGTVVADRLWDMLVSILGFASLLVFAREAFLIGYRQFLLPVQENAILTIGLIVAILVGLGILYLMRNKILNFIQGIRSSFDTQQKALMSGLSAVIWIGYAINALWGFYLCQTTGDWTIGDAWVLLMIAAVSTLIPTPGGFGSYHAFMIWALTTLWMVDRPEAAFYALINHAIQLIFCAIMGAWAFWHFRNPTPLTKNPNL